MSTAAKASRVSLAVFGSRILGLVRESVFAHLFGAGAASDAFRAAFKIPNLLRDLFAEGALSTAFVTTFSKTLEKEGEAKAWRLANLVFSLQWLVLSLLIALGILFAPQIVAVLATGMPAETQELAVQLTRIMFPFILLVSAAAIMMGLLNAKGRFGLPAAASIFFNLGSIIAGVGIGWLFDPKLGPNAIYGMALGVLVGGVLQFLVQVPAALGLGFKFGWAWDLKDSGLKEVLRLLGPAVIGASAVQINVLVNTNFASLAGPGAISWLEYAFRLMQFPIGLLGVAIATVTLPMVSRNAVLNDLNAFRSNLSKSVRLAFALTIPAAAGLAVLSDLLIRVVFERGRFLPTDTQATAQALQAYAIGLSGYAAIKVLAPGFYALGDPKAPLRVSLFGIVLNLILNSLAIFMLKLGHSGLALSTSLVALLNFAQLWFAMKSKLQGFEGLKLLLTLGKALAASAGMAASVYALRHWLPGMEGNFLGDCLMLAMSVILGMAVFALLALCLRLEEVSEIASAVLRRLKRR